jgi:hypothetical protein|tara:strand:- start:6065 stop:7135 length:1071 start_codon:yes stop_codon:yes gene_type:complete
MKDVKTLYSTPGSFGAGSGKSEKNTSPRKGKSFGYQVLGFGSTAVSGPAYVEATGGNSTFTVGDYKIHVFTGDGTLCVASQGKDSGNNKVDYLVIAGGGAGGPATGGGGGGGGYRESQDPSTTPLWTGSPLATCASLTDIGTGGLPVTVGAGGAGFTPSPSASERGANSVFGPITSTGGGAGGNPHSGSPLPTMPGGSGGGAGYAPSPGAGGGAGNTPPVSPPQGQPGSNGNPTSGGCGGGAGGAGNGASNGGTGVSSTIAPSSFGEPACSTFFYSGGGGGGTDQDPGRGGGGGGPGKGGGGRGGDRHPGGPQPKQGEAGDANTGGGGGGVGLPAPGATGNSGGSGIVVIRYKFQN